MEFKWNLYPLIKLRYIKYIFLECVTASGKSCPTGPWVYWTGVGPQQQVHYQGCVPFELKKDGSLGKVYEIVDLNSGYNRVPLVQGQNYDFFCPVITSNIGNFHPNLGGHRGVHIGDSGIGTPIDKDKVFERCVNLDANPHCKATKTLEQSRSPKLNLGNVF